MSIFPKRTIPGKGVTIHWHIQGPQAGQKTLIPKAYIAVRDPSGFVHPLFDEHVLAFPAATIREQAQPAMPSGRTGGLGIPGASVPLLVLASYLEGRQKRERLVSLLEGMQDGRHFYFHFQVPPLAPIGRYVLVSELRVEGKSIGSGTAEEDYFFVEDPKLEGVERDGAGGWSAKVRNPGPEPVQALLLEYPEGGEAMHSNLELPPLRTTSISLQSPKAFLVYSEGREMLSLSFDRTPVCLRNQDFLSLEKAAPSGRKISVLHRESQQAYELEGAYADIWSRAGKLPDPGRAEDPFGGAGL
jgi:hypothetical protein